MKDGWRMHTKERWDGQSLLLKKMLQEAGSERYLIFRYGFDRFVVYHSCLLHNKREKNKFRGSLRVFSCIY
ncbi:hypothetical protein [Butyricimonas faecihominis]|uniref:hypothetical protein n=2 Tax=Butyricimonas TaxID=574697 RepID=UPI0022DFAB5A|nr:hypothetical protein [Butyricimonas faecihominis]